MLLCYLLLLSSAAVPSITHLILCFILSYSIIYLFVYLSIYVAFLIIFFSFSNKNLNSSKSGFYKTFHKSVSISLSRVRKRTSRYPRDLQRQDLNLMVLFLWQTLSFCPSFWMENKSDVESVLWCTNNVCFQTCDPILHLVSILDCCVHLLLESICGPMNKAYAHIQKVRWLIISRCGSMPSEILVWLSCYGILSSEWLTPWLLEVGL